MAFLLQRLSAMSICSGKSTTSRSNPTTVLPSFLDSSSHVLLGWISPCSDTEPTISFPNCLKEQLEYLRPCRIPASKKKRRPCRIARVQASAKHSSLEFDTSRKKLPLGVKLSSQNLQNPTGIIGFLPRKAFHNKSMQNGYPTSYKVKFARLVRFLQWQAPQLHKRLH